MKKFITISLIVIALAASCLTLTAMAPRATVAGCDNINDCRECEGASSGICPSVTSRSAYLTDSNSGRVLYAKAENERYEIASMVKVMTALIVFESIDKGDLKLDELVTISHNAAKQTGSELFIDEGKSYSVHDLIKSVIVVSANDSSVALAERIAGSEEAFVGMMNDKARQLGMNDTVFTNPTGLPGGEQYSTARDVNRMTRELLQHKDYYKYSSIWLEDYTHPTGRVTQLANTNKLIRFYKGCDSGKTGYTNSAKYCLSASAMRADMRVVATLLGGEDSKVRFKEVSSMFDYAFANYKVVKLLDKSAAVDGNIMLSKAAIDSITPVTTRQISVLIARGEGEPRIELELVDNAPLPIAVGDKLGIAKVIVDDKVIDTVELVSNQDVAKASFWDYVKKICK